MGKSEARERKFLRLALITPAGESRGGLATLAGARRGGRAVECGGRTPPSIARGAFVVVQLRARWLDPLQRTVPMRPPLAAFPLLEALAVAALPLVVRVL
jgi:hypothetical protein